jgi:Ser/Thr protein kinase RdoA (MazF antagonist)
MTPEMMAGVALVAWGGSVGPPRLVKNRENIVFEVRLPDGQHAALRLHRPGYQSRASIEAELRWMQGLAGAGLPVPVPVRTSSGALVHEAAGRMVSLVSWLEGAPLGAAERPLDGSARDQADLMRRLGRLIARMHNLTDAMDLPQDLDRPRWDAQGYLGDAPLWGPFWANPAFTADELADVQHARSAAFGRMTALSTSGADFGLIHADCLRENVLVEGGEMKLIDFDDAGWGFRTYDLATAIVQSLEEPALPALVDGLTAGYRSERVRPMRAEADLLLFVMLRTFASAGWIATRAPPDDPRQRFYAARAARLARHVLGGTTPW